MVHYLVKLTGQETTLNLMMKTNLIMQVKDKKCQLRLLMILPVMVLVNPLTVKATAALASLSIYCTNFKLIVVHDIFRQYIFLKNKANRFLNTRQTSQFLIENISFINISACYCQYLFATVEDQSYISI